MGDQDEGTRGERGDRVAAVPELPGEVAGSASRPPTPGDALRALPHEAAERGTRFISAQAMQARLFSVYDAATAAEDALTLVQDQLTLTLNRSYYEATEIEAMAAQLDGLLALETLETAEAEAAGAGAGGSDPGNED